MSTITINHLPNELLASILLYSSDARSVSQCARVSKRFNTLVSENAQLRREISWSRHVTYLGRKEVEECLGAEVEGTDFENISDTLDRVNFTKRYAVLAKFIGTNIFAFPVPKGLTAEKVLRAVENWDSEAAWCPFRGECEELTRPVEIAHIAWITSRVLLRSISLPYKRQRTMIRTLDRRRLIRKHNDLRLSPADLTTAALARALKLKNDPDSDFNYIRTSTRMGPDHLEVGGFYDEENWSPTAAITMQGLPYCDYPALNICVNCPYEETGIAIAGKHPEDHASSTA